MPKFQTVAAYEAEIDVEPKTLNTASVTTDLFGKSETMSLPVFLHKMTKLPGWPVFTCPMCDRDRPSPVEPCSNCGE